MAETVIGQGSFDASDDRIEIGSGATSGKETGIAIGKDSNVSEGPYPTGIAIGTGSSAEDYRTVTVGEGAKTLARDSVAIGEDAVASEADVVVGRSASSERAFDSQFARRNVMVGRYASTEGSRNVYIGDGVDSVVRGVSKAVSIGYGSRVVLGESVSVGAGALSAERSVGIGDDAEAAAEFDDSDITEAISIGADSRARKSGSISIGAGTTINESDVARIGSDQLVFSGVSGTMPDASLNNSEITLEIDEANSQFVIRGKDSSGTVITGTVAY